MVQGRIDGIERIIHNTDQKNEIMKNEKVEIINNFCGFLICYKNSGTVGTLLPIKLYNYCNATPITDNQLAFFKIKLDGGYNRNK